MRCDMSYGCEVRAAGEKRKDTRKQHRDPDHETDDGHDRRVPTRGGRHGGRGESCGAGEFPLRRKKSKPRLSHRNVHSSYYLLYDLSAIHCAAARPQRARTHDSRATAFTANAHYTHRHRHLAPYTLALSGAGLGLVACFGFGSGFSLVSRAFSLSPQKGPLPFLSRTSSLFSGHK